MASLINRQPVFDMMNPDCITCPKWAHNSMIVLRVFAEKAPSKWATACSASTASTRHAATSSKPSTRYVTRGTPSHSSSSMTSQSWVGTGLCARHFLLHVNCWILSLNWIQKGKQSWTSPGCWKHALTSSWNRCSLVDRMHQHMLICWIYMCISWEGCCHCCKIHVPRFVYSYLGLFRFWCTQVVYINVPFPMRSTVLY